MDSSVRIAVAPFLPELIVKSLRPNLVPARLALGQVGLPDGLVADVLADAYLLAARLDYVRNASARTVALFTRRGVLEVPGAGEVFHHFGR